jgi:hypothetical protein
MTILFEEDWGRYPTAKPDYGTSNKLFVEFAIKQRMMGNRNYRMVLALHDQSLVGINPHDTTLSNHLKEKVIIEGKSNYWYYLRELVMVPSSSGRDAIHFRPNRGNIAMYWLYLTGIMPMVIQPRQCGKSFSLDVLTEWLMTLRSKDSLINYLTKDVKLRKESIARLKQIDSCLPPYVSRQTRLDADNTENFTVKQLNNRYVTHLPRADPIAANGLGRGMTSKDLLIDEVAFIVNIHISLPAAAAAMSAARDAADSVNMPSGMVLLTTAGSRDTKSGEYCYDMLMSAAVWSEQFYNAVNKRDLDRIVRVGASSGKPMVNLTMNHLQLGFTDTDLDRWIERSHGTKEMIDRDFRNMWTNGSTDSVFTPVILKKLKASARDPNNTSLESEGYIINWYIPVYSVVLSNRPIVYGLDSSDAVGRDNTALVFTDPRTGAPIGRVSINLSNLSLFATWLAELHIKYPKLIGNIERKSSGLLIMSAIMVALHRAGINPFTRLFNTIVQDADKNPDRFAEINHYDFSSERLINIYTKYVGFATGAHGAQSRNILFGKAMMTAVENNADNIADPRLISELVGLVLKDNRIDHKASNHDDHVVAFALANYVLLFGNNLYFYGLKGVLEDVRSDKFKNRKADNKRRKEMSRLVKKIRKAKDKTLQQRLSIRLDMLAKRYDIKVNEFNVDIAQDQQKELKSIKLKNKRLSLVDLLKKRRVH